MIVNHIFNKIHAEILVVGGELQALSLQLPQLKKGPGLFCWIQDSAPGGVGTRGGVHIYWYGSPGGKQDEIDVASHKTEEIFGGKPRGFHPEAKRSVIGEMLLEQGVNVVFNAMVYDVIQDGHQIVGVRAATPDGTIEARARVIIDATGGWGCGSHGRSALSKGRDVDGSPSRHISNTPSG